MSPFFPSFFSPLRSNIHTIFVVLIFLSTRYYGKPLYPTFLPVLLVLYSFETNLCRVDSNVAYMCI